MFAHFKTVPNEQKKEFGQVVNELKNLVNDKVNTLKEALEGSSEVTSGTDLTRRERILKSVQDIRSTVLKTGSLRFSQESVYTF